MDYFLDDKNCIRRLLIEWQQYGMLIIAVDYDNTLYDYYKQGRVFDDVVVLVRELKDLGCHITIFTSCNEDRFPEIEAHLKQLGVDFDSINETPDFIPFKGRKVYYNALLDDRAGLSAAYKQLKEVATLRRIDIYDQEHANRQDIDF